MVYVRTHLNNKLRIFFLKSIIFFGVAKRYPCYPTKISMVAKIPLVPLSDAYELYFIVSIVKEITIINIYIYM
jgi:hypothetical protein